MSLLPLLLASCSVVGVRSGYEHLSFEEVEQNEKLSIRTYPERLVVEISGAPDRRSAFRSLARYINGDNSTQQEVKMTVPVEMIESDGEKIEMTAPVEVTTQEEAGEVMMRFFLPSRFTMNTAPKPIDPTIVVKRLPAQTFAVMSYSGSTEEEKFFRKKEELLDALGETDWTPSGPVSFMGYDPPFTLPFLRRNEALVPVSKRL